MGFYSDIDHKKQENFILKQYVLQFYDGNFKSLGIYTLYLTCIASSQTIII